MSAIQKLLRPSTWSSSLMISRRLESSTCKSPTSGGPESQESNNSIRNDVINLYKNLIYLSREWPTDLRPQIRNAFMKNKDVQDVEEIRKLIARGEYVSREITATYHLRKYRAMKRRYYSEEREKQLEEMFKSFNY